MEFENNELLHNATVRMLEVIGEAAGKISDELKAAHPEIPWHEMVGMRNRLIHEYFRVSLQTVWDTVQKDLPELIDRLEALLPGES